MTDPLRAAPPNALLALLQALANRGLAGGAPGAVAVRNVELSAGEVRFEAAITAIPALAKRPIRLRLVVLETTPERTECRWETVGGRGFSRLVGRGLGFIPEETLDRWVGKVAGEGIRVRGDRVTIDHAACVRHWLAAKRGAAGGRS